MEPAFAESQFRELRRVGDLWRSWIPDDRVSLIAVMNDTFYRYRALGFQLETIAYCMGIDVSVAWDCLRMEASRSKAIPSTKPPSTSPIRLVNLMDAGSNSIHSTSTSTSTMSGDHAVSVSTSDLISTTRQVIDSSRTWSHEGRAVLIALGSESSGHRLTTESAKIRQALAFIGSIRVVPIPQVGPDDFRAEVAKWNPWVLHVAAHADGDDVWLTEDNEAVPVNGEFWFDVFKTLDQRMMMVVLSYCNSVQHAEALLQHADEIVCWSGSPTDEVATAFAKLLYTDLARGRSVREAFDHAERNLRLKYRDLPCRPVLFSRPGTRRLI